MSSAPCCYPPPAPNSVELPAQQQGLEEHGFRPVEKVESICGRVLRDQLAGLGCRQAGAALDCQRDLRLRSTSLETPCQQRSLRNSWISTVRSRVGERRTGRALEEPQFPGTRALSTVRLVPMARPSRPCYPHHGENFCQYGEILITANRGGQRRPGNRTARSWQCRPTNMRRNQRTGGRSTCGDHPEERSLREPSPQQFARRTLRPRAATSPKHGRRDVSCAILLRSWPRNRESIPSRGHRSAACLGGGVSTRYGATPRTTRCSRIPK